MPKFQRLPAEFEPMLADDEAELVAAEIYDRLHAAAASHGYDSTAACDLDDMVGALRFAI